jgi:predicted tellurium resistance membrane protein TerC
MSGLGSAFAPFISSLIVEMTDSTASVMQFCLVTLFIVAISLVVCHMLHNRTIGPQAAALT